MFLLETSALDQKTQFRPKELKLSLNSQRMRRPSGDVDGT